MRRLLWATLIGGAMLLGSAGAARAQMSLYSTPPGSDLYNYFTPPGYYANFWPYAILNTTYATTWGTPSFGAPRTYTAYSSPYGNGYGYGYYPMMYLPGYYGARLWRPGEAAPGYVYGAGFYGTAATPYQPLTSGAAPPPIGVSAPAFGPPPFFAW